jgi:hypothetical protein
MNDEKTRESRVFVPLNQRFGHPHTWPNVVGYLVRPLADMPCLSWFWFSRYCQPITDKDLQDCDPHKFPDEFYFNQNGQQHLVSFRFRYALDCNRRVEFEQAAAHIFERHGCIPRYFRKYSLIGDLGNDRFTAIEARRLRRSELVRDLVHTTSRLVLHALQESDAAGNYSFEDNAFDVPHHLICNITEKPG